MRRLPRRQRLAAIVLAALAVCFLTLDLGGGSLKSAHSGVGGTLGSLYRGTDQVMGPVRRFVEGVPSAGTNEAKVRELRREVAQLRAQVAARDADKATAARLDRLQLAATNGRWSIVPARVVALGNGAGFDWTITIDAGTNSGVRAGQTVTDGDGLVGRVLRADSSSSVVLLAADPKSGVGVRDVRNGEVGIATGRGASGFTFVPLDPTADVRAGDHLVTGPTGSTSFAPGLTVGAITSVRSSADGTTTAQVLAATSPTTLDLVGVILTGTGTSSANGRTALQPDGSSTAVQR